MSRMFTERRLTPRNIVILYLAAGTAWALLSAGTEFSPGLSTHGGFVAATSVLLYFLISRKESVTERTKRSLHRANRVLKAFSECNQALVRARDELHLMREICRTIVEVGGYRLAWVGIAENDAFKTIRPMAQWGDQNGYLEKLDVSWAETDRGRGPTGTAIRTGKTSVVQNILFDPKWELWREQALREGFAASISLPLMEGETAFGALVIFSEERGAFDSEEVRLLEELALDLSYGITTLRMNAERKKVEKERKLLASVIEQAAEGIILFDSEGLIQYANPAVQTITGRPPADMIGRNLSTLESGEFNNDLHQLIWEALSRGEARTAHFIRRGTDGEIHEIDSTIWSISDQFGSISNYAALIRDVTNEVYLERQLRQAQRMEGLATLAGGIAHDFNNNLASIITCSEMARDDIEETSPTRELVDVVLKSAYRARNLVKQILTFSCVGEQERQPVQIEAIAQECVKMLRASLSASIEIRCSIGQRVGFVMADPTQMHQIMMNLCTNASHAMREKGGVLHIMVNNADLDTSAVVGFPDLPSGAYVKLTVQDTGHGMDRKTMDRIFDPFFTTKKQSEGTGLGLSVIHGIVRRHGGAISVDSSPGKGAAFDVYLPRVDVVQPAASPDSPAQATRGKEHILFVDDEKDVVFSAKKMLERLGYVVTAATDAAEALAIYRNLPADFDLLITDQAMPLMNGTDLAQEILKIRPVPVILCTGFGHTEGGGLSPEERLKAGIRELALKPLDRSEMAAIIRRVLDDAAKTEAASWPIS